MQDTRERLESILRQRIAVLDGSWGVLIQREVRGEEAYRGERFRDHPRDVAGDPDLLNLTRPDDRRDIHGAYFAAGADIATTNTFTATHDRPGGLRARADVVEEMNLAGARLARAAADEWEAKTGALRRRLGRAAQRLALAVAPGRRPRVPHRDVRRGRGGVRGADPRAARRRRRPAPDRDGLRHAERKGRDRRRAGRRARAAALALLHRRRPQRPQPLRPDGRGVLDLGRARRSRSSSASTARSARPRCGRSSRTSRRSRRRGSRATRTPGCRTRSACTTSSPRTRAASSASSRATGSSTSSAAAAARRPSTSGRSSAAVEGVAPRAVPEPRARDALQRPRAVRDRRRDSNFMLIGERTNVTGSARFRRLVEARRLPGGARRRARAGARRREPPRREHGRRPARRRAGDDDVPQPRRDRARGRADPDHGRQLALVGARGRPQVHPGQGRRQLALAQGGRGAVPRAGARACAATAPASS